MMPPEHPSWLQRWQQADDDVLLYVDQTLLIAGVLPLDDPDLPVDLLGHLSQTPGLPPVSQEDAMEAMRQYAQQLGEDTDHEP